MILPLVILFLLGALQGAVGWIMVASGLTGDAVYVRPTKLALHFVLALVLLCYTYWFTLKFYVQRESLFQHKSLNRFVWIIFILLFVQLFYGAMMAGYRAAPYAPTWPDINGEMIPSVVHEAPPTSLSIEENKGWIERRAIITTHLIHRSLAYLLVILIIAWTIWAARIKATPAFRKMRWFPLVFVLWQTILGILTVISSTGIRAYRWNEFEWMAQLHQLTAIFLLISLLHLGYLGSVKGRGVDR